MEVSEMKDETLKRRMKKVFSEMRSILEAIMFVLGNSYTLKLQVRDASNPERVLWEKHAKLILDKKNNLIVPHVDGLPIVITLPDLLKSFKSQIEVQELPVIICWEFQSGSFKTLCYHPQAFDKLIIVSHANPIKLS